MYKDEEHSDSDDSDKSDSSDSEYNSDNEHKPKSTKDPAAAAEKTEKELSKKKPKPPSPAGEDKDSSTESSGTSSSLTKSEIVQKVGSGVCQAKEKATVELDKEVLKAPPMSPSTRDKSKVTEEARQPVSVDVDMDSDSERELVIDLGEEPGGRERKRRKKDSAAVTALKEPTASKTEGELQSELCQHRHRDFLLKQYGRHLKTE